MPCVGRLGMYEVRALSVRGVACLVVAVVF